MGKNFPRITTLKETPECFDSTIALIEKSFRYQAPYTFKEDFAPLLDLSNHHNCFILIDENKNVLAHIGVREKMMKIQEQEFMMCMLGGIAVDENHRGEGHFSTLLQDVLAEKRSDVTFFLLWSDNEKLYGKYGFYLCGDQFELAQDIHQKKEFIQTKYKNISLDEKKQVQELYRNSFAKEYLTLERDDHDWELIAKIVQADLYIKKSGNKITDYFFMNKGQDLTGIIYEYGSTSSIKDCIQKATAYGRVWMGKQYIETENQQFQFFMAPGDLGLFSIFIKDLTQSKIILRNINVMKQEAYFEFNEETLSLSNDEFLKGMFGPGSFEELDDVLKTVFISGIDSV